MIGVIALHVLSVYPGPSLPTKGSDLVSYLIIFRPQVKGVCQQMKEHMYTVYEENSSEVQVKLQELFEVLENCTKLSNELLEASQALASLSKSLAISQTSESL